MNKELIMTIIALFAIFIGFGILIGEISGVSKAVMNLEYSIEELKQLITAKKVSTLTERSYD